MSKAFDTINRKLLLEELEEVLEPDEMHILSIITNRPILSIKLEDQLSDSFETYQGICQGDCLSAVLFIFYLARALKDETTPPVGIYIDPKYADDITYLTTIKELRNDIKTTTAHRLDSFNLTINNTKTEEYEVPDKTPAPAAPPPPTVKPTGNIEWSDLDWLLPQKTTPPEPEWKKCKLLGSKIDTKEDIKSRKATTWEPINLLRPIFKSKRISTALKIRAFRTYVEPALLYNAELWTLTPTLEKQINAFHRRLLRIASNIHYPKTIKSTKLYSITKTQELSTTIKRRRISLFESPSPLAWKSPSPS